MGPGGIREGHGGMQQHDAHRQQSKFREHRECHQGVLGRDMEACTQTTGTLKNNHIGSTFRGH